MHALLSIAYFFYTVYYCLLYFTSSGQRRMLQQCRTQDNASLGCVMREKRFGAVPVWQYRVLFTTGPACRLSVHGFYYRTYKFAPTAACIYLESQNSRRLTKAFVPVFLSSRSTINETSINQAYRLIRRKIERQRKRINETTYNVYRKI